MKTHTEELGIINDLLTTLFPICRSITGNGVRNTLHILNDYSKFDIKEISSGTECFDWTIPEEWNIDDAFIKNSSGEKIIDFKKNNLHVVNYSIPINQEINFTELKSHLHTLPNMPDAIPYRTTYYKKNWGFCLQYNEFKKLNKSEIYHVEINSSLKKGSLTYGEFLIKGELEHEIIFSSYCCHPSMANDNLSGMILWLLLLKYLKNKKTKYSYRFIIAPETIGSISYLSKNKNNLKNTIGGFILTCVGGTDEIIYNSTFQETHLIDNIAENTFSNMKIKYKKIPFKPIGSDERQYSSPGFRIPMSVICKSQFHNFDYYHTSLDNLEFVSSDSILQTYLIYINIIENLENLQESQVKPIVKHTQKNPKNSKYPVYETLNPFCEPMLSKRGLYPELGGALFQPSDFSKNNSYDIELLSTILFYSDSNTTVEQISDKSGFSKSEIEQISEKLVTVNLLKRVR